MERIAKRREEKARLWEIVFKERAKQYGVALVVSWFYLFMLFLMFCGWFEDVGVKPLRLS